MNKHFRNCFVPDIGYRLLEVDYVQAEAVIVAHLSKDHELIKDFNEGIDIHSKTGAFLYNKSFDWVVENKKTNIEAKHIRTMGKKFNHAYNYQIGARQMQKELMLDGHWLELSEAKRLLQRMDTFKPCVSRWQEEIKTKIIKQRELITPFGYRYPFLGLLSEKTFKFGYSFIPQSTIGHMLNLAWIALDAALNEEIDILLNVHDSLLMQVPLDSNIENIMRQVQELMTIPVPMEHYTFTVDVDFKLGEANTPWGSLKEVKL